MFGHILEEENGEPVQLELSILTGQVNNKCQRGDLEDVYLFALTV